MRGGGVPPARSPFVLRNEAMIGARWIFGYGSLVWRPAFEHLEARPARLRGFARRFWQGSTDHRGVPGAPGRVVTLVRDAEAECVGMAYLVSETVWAEVLGALDHREKGGYERVSVELALLPEQGAIASILYIAGPENPNYLGPAPSEIIVDQIARSHGPSGPNDEYLLRLEEALRELDAHDAHVFELAALLRARR